MSEKIVDSKEHLQNQKNSLKSWWKNEYFEWFFAKLF